MATEGKLNFTLTAGPKGEAQPDEFGDEQQPLRFLVLGDFSRGAEPSFESRAIDFDNFDEVLAKVSKTMSSLDQFHPDFLIESRPELARLHALSRRLKSPATRDAAQKEVAELIGAAVTNAAAAVPPPAETARAETARAEAGETPGEGDQQLLSRLLGDRPASVQPAAKSTSPSPPPAKVAPTSAQTNAKAAVDQLVQRALGKSSAPSAAVPNDPDVDDQVQQRLTEACRNALSDPEFRALERAWRSVHWLVSRLQSDQGEVHLADISKAALTQHLTDHAADLDSSPLVQLLLADEEGWDFIIGDYSFGLEAQDLMLLGNLAVLAARAGAPFLAHGELGLAGCPGPDAVDTPHQWTIRDSQAASLLDQVRQHPATKFVGLATPRFVLRHPYGKRSDPIDSFPFEELPPTPRREDFLWANPAFACAWILGEANSRGGARWPTREISYVRELPMPPYHDGTGEAMQPPLEFLLGEAARAVVEQHGLIAFSGGRNDTRIAANTLHPLAGA